MRTPAAAVAVAAAVAAAAAGRAASGTPALATAAAGAAEAAREIQAHWQLWIVLALLEVGFVAFGFIKIGQTAAASPPPGDGSVMLCSVCRLFDACESDDAEDELACRLTELLEFVS